MRFPGKMMAQVRGKTVLERTVSIARAVTPATDVIVATDDPSVRVHAEQLGVQVAWTPEPHRNGTERVLAAVRTLRLEYEILINLQGDAILTPPWVVEALLHTLSSRPDISVATPVVRLNPKTFQAYGELKKSGRASGTSAAVRPDGYALYFSKAVLPHLRDVTHPSPPAWRHIGCYGYRLAALTQYVALPPTPLEEAEQLEQLRFLEHGIPVLTVPVDYRGRTHGSIDYPEDIAHVGDIIAREGELAPFFGAI